MTNNNRNIAISNALRKRMRTFNRIEKVFYGTVILTAIIMAISIVYLQSRNLEVQQEITNLNSQISDVQTEYNNAKQEVNELTSRDRIQKIAGQEGLSSQQNNIKQVE
ncbi:cell division protein FtsL [Streptococcus alactolyticus]|jgi:cell division protein FtsL|uniref:Cell division protein FtsL n=2 Tax=Streptococcus TaxID=1301 RepID=A0A9D2FUK2_9STRE|nr:MULTISPECIES: cell division protein FtsL [Streptococcus]HIZ67110.1 cell division protein FtsL [Candidatus Streptococcus faecavium]MCF2665465.1 cell division protein FtsL [Streptococcus alactolyticus]MCF2677459.1 cell division protein FtsL [Streptococcus alactolyticus]MDD7362266.1 cell division protein FtsL [Streptococcus alactolyticus]MDY5186405.1 cell division protein FtsL [Streptococcus alactolyticus]